MVLLRFPIRFSFFFFYATNLLAISSQTNLKRADASVATAMERLASGLRVNSAKDDAAGQAIGNRMTAQVTGLNQAQRNANDGVSMSQTAHGALDQINERLHRIRELTVQGLNGSLGLRDTDVIQAEINENLKEIDRLAESTNYNGIPLLSGRAGQIDLQVGANDNEMLGIDLAPPGFSVQELGLEEFTIAGIEGEVTARNQLFGLARDIHLDDTRTSVSFPSLPGADSDYDFKLMPGNDGPYSYYISNTTGTNPIFYKAAYPGAVHDTATNSSTVTMSHSYQIYDSPSTLATDSLTSADIQITDAAGNAFSDGATRRLVMDGSTYLVEETDANGITRHYEAELSFVVNDGSPTGVTLSVGQSSTALSGLAPAPTAITGDSVTHNATTHDLDAADTLEYVDSNGNALTNGELVEVGGHYYLRATDTASSDTIYYELSSIQESSTTSGTPPNTTTTTTLTFQADTSHGDLDPVLSGTTSSSISSPGFSFSGQTVELQDQAGNSLTGRLMEHYNDDYMIEVDEGGGAFSYYQATLSVTANSSGDPTTLVAKATEAAPSATFRTEEADTHNVLTVSGTSIVTIDPRNVEVNYTDANGEVHNDVLRAGSEGDNNYYFDLPNSHSDYGSFKIASLYDSEGGDILIKTINGQGEVIIYHPADNLTTGQNLWVSVQTDANGFENDDSVANGTPHTILNIIENPQEIRFKTPKNPLAALDRAISHVDSKRSHLGAMENRLASVIEGNAATSTNLSAARSRIMDADYAVEVSDMTRAQILQQAGTSVLAQANQLPQNVLSLLE